MTPTAPILSAHPSDVERARDWLTTRCIGALDSDLRDADTQSLSALLAIVRTETLEEAAKIADEKREDAERERADYRESLGDMYDVNCYGSGHTEGERSAAYDIAQAIRSKLSPPTGESK